MSSVTLPMSGGTTDKGPNRPANQDAFYAEPPRQPALQVGAFYLVADGVGGQQKGDEASKIAVSVIPDTFYQLRTSAEAHSIPKALHGAFKHANQAINERAQALELSKMSTTAVAAVVHEGKLHLAHAGDARAYLLRSGTRQLTKLTKDHSWVQEQVDAGIIEEKDAEGNRFGNIVTRVLGNNGSVKPEITPEPRPLRTDDLILLCSDGLYRTLSEPEIVKLMLQANSPEQATKELVAAAVQANAEDNITAVVIEIGPVTGVYRQPNPLKENVGDTKIPLWIPLLVISLVILALVIIYFAFRTMTAETSQAALMAAAPTVTAVLTTAVGNSNAVIQVVPEEQPTQPAASTAAEETAPTASANPTSTLAPTPTALAFAQINPNVGELPVWPTEALSPDICADSSLPIYAVTANEQIRVLERQPTTFLGPPPDCEPFEFVQVRSEDRSNVTGWILFSQVVIEETSSSD